MESVITSLSRVVDRRFVLGDREKERFRKMMRSVDAFCGVQVVTYVIMSNHFHILVGTPEVVEITDEELYERIEAAYPRMWVQAQRQVIDEYRSQGCDDFTRRDWGRGEPQVRTD